MRKPELLAPAGNMEKLKYALHYGADAVYLAGTSYGLRAKAGNFSIDEMYEAVKYVHDRDKKIYITMNIIPHNQDFEGMKDYVKILEALGVDGVIVADPGIIMLIKEIAPELKISLSTQGNTTNYYSAKFWHQMGINRIVLARELSIQEIKTIIDNTPDTLEIETFIHGAMCISYSGRCLLSNYMANRDANKGDCAQPCRWNYSLMEKTRENEYFPVYEDERGTYVFNSKDLCLIENIPELIKVGVNSFKIEGRMKSVFYVATVVRAYRKSIDEYLKCPQKYVFNTSNLDELKKVSHREYTSGFALNKPTQEDQNYTSSTYVREYDFVGIVLDYNVETQIATIEQRNKIEINDTIEIMRPNEDFIEQKVLQMWNEEDQLLESTPHPKMIFRMKMNSKVEPMDLLRKALK
ncbi:U32 family peptidase [Alkalibaculum sp. M08DMB]|uniref:U32 family peptidase n=1 Tax=Alkalibaculum sporogenes TaxID=2655001 RepID=A0A6A7KAK2_9FIRM|nr:U32 family peptidase [Alkalibaculum sporogenes]MPW26311.1 U32 family peptidase [Alkalibaculum sporogenes]